MSELIYVDLKQNPELRIQAAEWFNRQWNVPTEAYLGSIEDYICGETDNGWYICMDGEQIIAGLGVIDNDYHDRQDLTPNVVALYTDEEYRCRGIAGQLLNMAVEGMRRRGISPLYLLTDRIGFVERYGWEFVCMLHKDDEPEMFRAYVHR